MPGTASTATRPRRSTTPPLPATSSDTSELILRYWIEFRNDARLETLLAWLDGLPPLTVSADPRLCLVRATTLQEVGRIAEAGQWLDAAARGRRRRLARGGSGAAVASGVAASQSINQYFLGDVRGMAETARPALDLEEAASEYWRSALLTTYGVSRFLGGDGQAASALLDEAVTSSESSSHSLALIHALGWCAVVHAELGDVGPCGPGAGRGRRAAAKGTGAGELHRDVDDPRCSWSAAASDRADWSEADEALARGTELARQGQRQVRPLLRAAHARAGEGCARRPRAPPRTWLREARQVAEACVDPGILPELVARAEARPPRSGRAGPRGRRTTRS